MTVPFQAQPATPCRFANHEIFARYVDSRCRLTPPHPESSQIALKMRIRPKVVVYRYSITAVPRLVAPIAWVRLPVAAIFLASWVKNPFGEPREIRAALCPSG